MTIYNRFIFGWFVNGSHGFVQSFIQSRLQSLIVGIYNGVTVRDGYNLKTIYSI